MSVGMSAGVERSRKTVGVGVLGLGFMGRTHVAAYGAAARDGFPCELRAVCDASPERLTGEAPGTGNLRTDGGGAAKLFDPARVRGYTDPEQLFRDPGVDLVSVCTYTDTHVEFAERALAAGKHVLVEKPVSLRAAEIRGLADVARRAGRVCMPAMCMRFWPGWDWLRDRVREGTYGGVRSATFQRLGSGPSWGKAFYDDESRSGGALVDLHIHDVDFLVWCFGRPTRVRAAGTTRHLTALYEFNDGPAHVSAEGAWDLAPTSGFRMRYLVNFEGATAEFDLSRQPPLMLHTGGGSGAVELGPLSGYDHEVRHLVKALSEGRSDVAATLEEAAVVAEILDLERAQLRSPGAGT